MELAEDGTRTSESTELPDDLPLPRAGELVGNRYRIGRRLGQGGMGVVHEAVHEEIGRRHAVKFLRRELAYRARSLERFQREARLLGGMNHPHITQVFDFGRHRERTPYIVMEYLEGLTLREVLTREGPFAPPRAITIMRQICRAMAYAHARGVVHRDLKPDNLMRLSEGDPLCVKILDFGIAQYATPPDTRLTPSGAVLGTSHYMSPEQTRGDVQLGAATDVYSLGVIFYELLSCRRPHPGESYAAVLFHVLTQPPVPLPDVMPGCAPELWEVIARCLCAKPEERYPTAGELLVALDSLAEIEAPIEPATNSRLAAPAPKGLVRGRAWRGVAVGAAAGALLTALLLPSGREPAEPAAASVLAAPAAPQSDAKPAPIPLIEATAALVAPAPTAAAAPSAAGRAPSSVEPRRTASPAVRANAPVPAVSVVIAPAKPAERARTELTAIPASSPTASALRFLSQNPYE